MFGGHAGALAALAELDTLFEYLDAMGSAHAVSFDLSLARGLDYYEGVYEAVIMDGTSTVGSIAAGGRCAGRASPAAARARRVSAATRAPPRARRRARGDLNARSRSLSLGRAVALATSAARSYDNLAGMFSASGVQTPCVGVSIGVERVFTVMEAKMRAAGAAKSDVQVLVASVSKNMLPTKMAICRDLWAAGVPPSSRRRRTPR